MEEYKTDPFPHIVIKTLVPDFSDIWPNLKEVGYFYNAPPTECNKYVSKLRTGIPQKLLNYIDKFNQPEFLGYLSQLTGIADLIPDNTLEGGGLHETMNGGYLKLHSDFPYKGKLHRRVNMIIFLNDNWKDEYNGHLELWDKEVENCVLRVAPERGTVVIFNTLPESWHGHPEPLNCPEGMTRKSIALYYYTKERPQDEIEEKRNSKWAARPQDIEDFGGKFIVT